MRVRVRVCVCVTQVTAVHKANIMKLGDGLFLKVWCVTQTHTARRALSYYCCLTVRSVNNVSAGMALCPCVHMCACVSVALQACREVAAQFPTIQFEEMIVDNTCMQLVNRPEQFDVMVSYTVCVCVCVCVLRAWHTHERGHSADTEAADGQSS